MSRCLTCQLLMSHQRDPRVGRREHISIQVLEGKRKIELTGVIQLRTFLSPRRAGQPCESFSSPSLDLRFTSFSSQSSSMTSIPHVC
jgi:hypothetical protein